MKRLSFFKILLAKIFVFRKVLIFEKSLSGGYQTENEERVKVRLAQNSDISRLPSIFEKFECGEADRRLEAGHLCFVAEENGSIVNHLWVAFNEIYLKGLDRKLQMGSDSAYLYDAYTVPKYRHRGISVKVNYEIFEHLFKTGFEKAVYIIVYDNRPSRARALHFADKIGSRNMGEIIIFGFPKLGRYVHICRGETFEDHTRLKEMFNL